MRPMKPLCLLALMYAPTTWGCQCFGLSVEEQVEMAAHVFRARVTSAEVVESYPEGDGKVKARFDVIATLKGTPETLDGVVTPLGAGACEIPIIVGLEYVFFVTADGEANSCGGTILRRRFEVGNSSEWFDFVRRYDIGPD